MVLTKELLAEHGDIMKACAVRDCRRRYFMRETMRWVKKALADVGKYQFHARLCSLANPMVIGVVIYENPMATAALLIGVSVLVAELINPGILVPTALEVIGFGSKGPIKSRSTR
jgi:hypothetical protein